MKVYIVIDGCVGDEGISNVFKTREIAEKWVEKNKKKLYKPYIEEWDVFNKFKDIEDSQGSEHF